MRSDSSNVLSGETTYVVPQNANNMSGLLLRMQYHPLWHLQPVKPEIQKTRNLLILNVLHPQTDKNRHFGTLTVSEGCGCTNHP